MTIADHTINLLAGKQKNARAGGQKCWQLVPAPSDIVVAWTVWFFGESAELEGHVLSVAEQITKVPFEFLALEKQALNKCLDLMGARDAIDYSATLHAVSHRSAAGLDQEEALYKSKNWRKAVEEGDKLLFRRVTSLGL